MHLPATGKTMALAVDEPAVDVGGTGLTTKDFQAFFSKAQPEKIATKRRTAGRPRLLRHRDTHFAKQRGAAALGLEG